MGWLDDHSGSVTAIATIVLAAITAVYVLLTRTLAKSSQRAINEAQVANRHATEANELTQQTIGLELESRLRQQASKIVAWVRPGHTTSDGQTYAYVAFANKSDEPAWQCEFKVLIDSAEYLGDLPIIGPWEAPNEKAIPIAAPPREGARVALDFSFTDNAGVRWRRGPTGGLSRVS